MLDEALRDALRVTHYIGVVRRRGELLQTMARKESTWLGDGWAKPKQMHHPKLVVVEELVYNSLTEFAARLPSVVAGNQEVALCMSQPTAERRAVLANNMPAERKGGFDPAVPKYLLPFDIDNLPFPAKYDLFDDTDEILTWIRDEALPPEFRDVPMVAVMTSSCGLQDVTRISARLFFWGIEPRSPVEMRRYVNQRLNPYSSQNAPEWRNTKRVCDASIYSRGQPIYVMRPALTGAPDPWARRVFCIQGLEDGLQIEVPEKEFVPDFSTVPDELAREMIPGNVWTWVDHIGTQTRRDVMLKMSFTLASRTPEARVGPVIDKLYEVMRATVPDPDPAIGAKMRKSIIEAFNGARLKIRQRQAVKGTAPDREVLQVSRGNMEEQLGAAVQAAFQNGPTRHTLALVDVGGGKTHAVLMALTPALLRERLVHFLVPDHQLAQSVIEDHRHIHGEALVFHHQGRARLCTNEHYGAIATLAESVGRSPYKVACSKCPLHDSCKYIEQRNYQGTGLVVSTHSHISTTYHTMHDRQTGEVSASAPALVIVDESPLATFLNSENTTRDIGSLGVGEVQLVAQTYKHDYKTLAGLLSEGRQQLKDIIGHRGSSLGVGEFVQLPPLRLATLRAHEADLQRAVHKALDKALDENNDSLVRRLDAVLKASTWVDTAYRAVETSRRLGRKWVFGLIVREKKAQAFLRAPLPPVLRQRHTIWLDATGNEAMMRRVVGGIPLTVVRAQIHPGNYRLVQYPDRTFSKSDLLPAETRKEVAARERLAEGDPTAGRDVARGEFRKRRADSNIARLHALVLRLNAKLRLERRQALPPVLDSEGKPTGEHRIARVLVIAQKAVREALEALGLPSDVVCAHYNAVRGQNWYREMPGYVVVGRPWQGNDAAERSFEALTYDDPQILAYVPSERPTVAKRSVEMADGSWVEIDAEGHPDALVNAIFQVTAEAEVRQAVGRARIVSRKDKPNLVVLGQCDAGVPVHELKHWVDQERDLVEIMREAGIAIQNPNIFQLAYPGMIGKITPDRKSRSEQAFVAAYKYLVEHQQLKAVTPSDLSYKIRESLTVVDRRGLLPQIGEYYVVLPIRGAKRRLSGNVMIDLERYPDPRAAFEDLIGVKADQWSVPSKGEQAKRASRAHNAP